MCFPPGLTACSPGRALAFGTVLQRGSPAGCWEEARGRKKETWKENGCLFSVFILGDWELESQPLIGATSWGPSIVSDWSAHQLQQPKGPQICAKVFSFCKHSAISGFSTVSFWFTNYDGGQKEATLGRILREECLRTRGRLSCPNKVALLKLPRPSLYPLLFFPTPETWALKSKKCMCLGECLFARINPSPPTS